jgi:hypothetical protein
MGGACSRIGGRRGTCISYDRLYGLVVRVFGYRSGGPGGSGTGSTQPLSPTDELRYRQRSGSCLENREYARKDSSR